MSLLTSRIKQQANAHLGAAAIMFILALAAAIFAVLFYQEKSVVWLIFFALAAVGFAVTGAWNAMEWARLKRIARDERCEEVGIFCPPRGQD